jgi:hypothetical protein
MQSLDLTVTRSGVMFDGQGITKHPVAEGQVTNEDSNLNLLCQNYSQIRNLAFVLSYCFRPKEHANL